MDDKPRFKCGYAGETEYEWRGNRYSVRSQASWPERYNGDYFWKGVLPLCGCIRADSLALWHQFPPEELCAFFPEYTPARFRADYSVEYKGPAPIVHETTTERSPWRSWESEAWREHRARMEAEYARRTA